MFDLSNLTTNHNYASVTDPVTGIELLVESFDNLDFDLYLMHDGMLPVTKFIGSITASSDEQLVSKINNLVNV